MVYINWSESSFIIQSAAFKWYSVECLIDYLHDLRAHILQQGGTRKDLKTSILASTPLPATEKQRFEGCYVCEAVGDYGYKLDEIGLKFIKLSNNKCHRVSSTSEAELDVLGIIHDMLKSIESKKDIMDQCTFEARYGLMWKTTSEDTQEHDVMDCPNIFCQYYKNTVVYVFLLLRKAGCNKKTR
ncbi:hypothetical protein MAM1_0116d05711 [Mucor ambiguus]|uniref:Uncharacterized protein n=1 Tax=Mucor ambiguus TaxID=91626 RepID=A0A0C9M7T1_9FUNG|nr:hypothetical protein MAM1_0116d05711 [Mucor ambiguus]